VEVRSGGREEAKAKEETLLPQKALGNRWAALRNGDLGRLLKGFRHRPAQPV